MKILIPVILLALFFSCSSVNNDFVPENQKFDFDWKFYLGDEPSASEVNFDDSKWRLLDIPHDFSIEQPFDSLNPSGQGGGYAYSGVGWYRKHFIMPKNTAGKRIEIQFNGVYRNSEIWINGNKLGFRPYGYSTFRYNLTPYINESGQENIIAVRVNTTEQPNSRWYTGAGIYRHVWLKVSDLTHFVSDGIFVKTESINDNKAYLTAFVEIKNDDRINKSILLKAEIFNKEGKMVSNQESSFDIASEEYFLLNQKFEIEQPKLWSIEEPELYSFNCTLESEGEIIDIYNQKIGIRTFSFDPDKGFFLNGEHVKLKGTNNHHDGGPLGAACFDYTFERQLKILKSMGCNALRMSHNPPAPELLDCADSLGFVVIDEIFDEWINGKRAVGYSPHFEEWYTKDVTSWIRRDRNHPSVIAWSLGNEVPEQKMEVGPSILEKIKKVAVKSDATRPFTAGCNEVPGINKTGFGELLDIIGYNYQEPMYSDDHKKYPKRVIFGSETAIYPYHPGKEFPLHSYEQWVEGQTSDYIAGEFIWTGFDYIGEAGIGNGGTSTEPWKYWPQWPWRSAVCGVIDLCGFEKPGYWFRKALWSDEPVVYIAVPTELKANNREVCPFWGWPSLQSHWNYKKEGEILSVQVYSNCQEVELLLNDKSLGKKKWDIQKEAFLVWNVPYSKGKLEAIGTSADGKKIFYSVRTVDKPYMLKLLPERKTINANKQDVSYVKVEVLDKDGNLVFNAENMIELEISGAGKLAAAGNGNPESHTSFKGNRMETFQGRCLAIVQSSGIKGEIIIKAKSEGLKAAETIIFAGK